MSKVEVILPPKSVPLRVRDLQIGHLYRRVGKHGQDDVVLVLKAGCLLTIYAACGNQLTWGPWVPEADYEFEFIGKLEVKA